MPTYLTTGPNGVGKSTVGRALESRSYKVTETDFADELAGWVNMDTTEKVQEWPPYPFPEKWVKVHRWIWDKIVLENLISKQEDQNAFFVGGAYNQKDMYELLNEHFTLFVDDTTAVKQLQGRGEDDHWQDGSPELQKSLDWNRKSKSHALEAGSILIDDSRPVEDIVDEIVSYVSNN